MVALGWFVAGWASALVSLVALRRIRWALAVTAPAGEVEPAECVPSLRIAQEADS